MRKYTKLFYCVCDGQQEKMYLDHISKLLRDCPRRTVKFNSTIGNSNNLLNSYVDYDRVALFDHDLNEYEFNSYIELCNRLDSKKSSKCKLKQKTHHAYSNLNFDLWLLLHKKDFSRSVISNGAYVSHIRKVYGLGNTDDIKSQAIISKILSQITLDEVKAAITRAERIREAKLTTDGLKVANTIIYENPDFSIHDFLKVVLTDCGVL